MDIIVVQSCARRFLAVLQARKRLEALVTMQRFRQRVVANREESRLQETNRAALRIQVCAVHSKESYNKCFLQIHVPLQTVFRRKCARELVSQIRTKSTNAAGRIQSAWRGWLARNKLSTMHAKANRASKTLPKGLAGLVINRESSGAWPVSEGSPTRRLIITFIGS